MSLGIKEMVSKNKLRYKEDGFDLDLSYISRNIIAMGFPAEKLERFYRNNINDVIRFFESKHKNQYQIYNLCSESTRRYDPSKFNGKVIEEFSFQDHNPPPFDKLKPFCESVHNWLTSDENNVVAVHCKAGKGRTGVMICAYLLHSGQCQDIHGKLILIPNAESALDYYGRQRTRDKRGVTIPSQQRYVYYYDYLVKHNLEYQSTRLKLVSLILPSLPVNFSGAYTLICDIFHIPKQKIKSFEIEVKKGQKHLTFDIPGHFIIQDDIKFSFHIKKMKKDKLFQFCINTFFVGFGTDTYTVATEPCSDCPYGEKVYVFPRNSITEEVHDPSTTYLQFLEYLKNENMYRPCDCTMLYYPPNISSLRTGEEQETHSPSPIYIAPIVLRTFTGARKMSKASSSSASPLSKRTITPDIKTNTEKNIYLVITKNRMDKAYKDKSNKTFPKNFNVILRFVEADDDSETTSLIQEKSEDIENSESENATSEDDDEPSDIESSIITKHSSTTLEQSSQSTKL